jgi:formylglycine-generating enzyme required for sulfatase activity
MKSLAIGLKLLSYLIIICPLTLHAADTRGMKVVIRDHAGQQVGLYENSYALVIGVSDYTAGWPKLPGVKKDIAAVKESLEKHGFQVTVVENPNCERLKKAYDDFINQYGQNPYDRLLFYFAGHGHTVKLAYGGEMGYIVPADAPNPERDSRGFLAKATDMQMVEVYAKRIQSKHALFLFDSCFSGKLFAISRAVPENITYKTVMPVRQFITSGSADEEVPDKSIFCLQFIEALNGEGDIDKDGYVTGTELGEFLEKTVINYTKNYQHPQYGKIRDRLLDKGDFVFLLLGQKWEQPIPMPSESKFSIDDLKEVDRAEALKAAWASRKKEMEKAFSDVTDYQKSDAPPERKVTAWERFVDAFREDNPYSQEDDRMRQEASQHIAHWKAEQSKASEKSTQIPSLEKPAESPPLSKGGEGGFIGKDGAEMVLIPAGEFQMGSNDYDDEKPVHTVYLDAFYMDKYEVTNALYKKFMDATGHKAPVYWNNSKYNAPDQPVVGVSWHDAKAYADWAGKRLPTEAEWEKAARGGLVGKKYPWGDELTRDYANYYGNGGKDQWSGTAPVGSFDPNGYDLYDMAGNVWEWCADRYDSDYYVESPKDNPQGPSSGTYRVLRGGAWNGDDPDDLRAATRYFNEPTLTGSNVGFRCVAQD